MQIINKYRKSDRNVTLRALPRQIQTETKKRFTIRFLLSSRWIKFLNSWRNSRMVGGGALHHNRFCLELQRGLVGTEKLMRSVKRPACDKPLP